MKRIESNARELKRGLLSTYLVKFVFKRLRFFTDSDHLFLVVFVSPVLDLRLNLGKKTTLDGQMSICDMVGFVEGAFQSVSVRAVLRS